MLAASSTWAGQADLSLETRLGGDSNVFRQAKAATQDGTFDISPRIAFRDDDADLTYGADYMPTYRTFFQTSGIDGVDHKANARLGWLLSPVDSIEASGSHFNGRQFLFGSAGSGAGSTFAVNDRERIRISDANLAYSRSLSPRASLRLDGYFDDFDASGTSPSSQTDSRAYTGKVSTQYVLTPRLVVGLSGSGRRRENRPVGNTLPATRTDVWDVLVSASYEITPTLNVSLQIGPSFIRQQQMPGGSPFLKRENSTTNFFAAASMRQEWKTSSASIAYVRSEARSGNAGSSSSINDDLQLDWRRRLNDQITLSASGTWDRYVQVSDAQGSVSEFTIDILYTTETIEFALSRHVLLIGQYTYLWQNQQTTSGTTQSDIDVDAHVGFVGIRYSFEPLSY